MSSFIFSLQASVFFFPPFQICALLFKTLHFESALSLVAPPRISRLGWRQPPLCDEPRTRLAQKEEGKMIYNHIRKARPKVAWMPTALSISSSVSLSGFPFCLPLASASVALHLLSHRAQSPARKWIILDLEVSAALKQANKYLLQFGPPEAHPIWIMKLPTKLLT